MESFVRLSDRLSVVCGVASGVLMVFSTLLVAAEIVARTTFDKTLYITEEYSGYLMAALTWSSELVQINILFNVSSGKS